MRFKAGPVVAGFMVLLVAATLVFGLGPDRKHQTKATEAATSTPTSEYSTTPAGVLSEKDEQELLRQVRGFLKAYYLLKPDDTTESRRERVAPFVPEKDRQKYLAGLGLGVDKGTEADKARIEGGWVQRAKRIEPFKPALSSYDLTIWVVGASLMTTMSGPDGKKPDIPTQAAMLWQKQSGRWVLRSFKEGGEVE